MAGRNTSCSVFCRPQAQHSPLRSASQDPISIFRLLDVVLYVFSSTPDVVLCCLIYVETSMLNLLRGIRQGRTRWIWSLCYASSAQK